jgi:hyperosmotically inducible protein
MKSDMDLKHQVEDEPGWDPAVDAAAIGVEVRDRVVTLSGHLTSYAEKMAAEKATQRVAGVKAVVVEMDVRLLHTDVRTDEEIDWTVSLGEQAVKVQVEKGWVT